MVTPRSRDRASKASLEMAENARIVLERRYLARDEQGRTIETPEELFRRVARNVAQADRLYGASDDQVRAIEDCFYSLMTSFRFLPNSPTLVNAGRPLQQLSACFVLPVEDSIEGIFDAIKYTALIHKSGGGTGFSFSRLRPDGDIVRTTSGVASGPVSFMKVFDASTEAIKQGGFRRGANMGILSIHHPDIEKFIDVKSDMVTLTNFNISVGVTEAFMQAVETGGTFDLINPRTGQVVGQRDAREIFRRIVENAWRNGDPGMVFLDRMNDTLSNPVPPFGPIEATNPCGEQPLYPYDSCNLGSINLAKFVTETPDGASPSGEERIDWNELARVVADSVHFLDNVIDVTKYPIPPIEQVSKQVRRIGLGVMGWADMLYLLRIPYDSEEALQLAEQIMAFLQEKANTASVELAKVRGVFPAWEQSIYNPDGPHARPAYAGPRYRNATRTTIAPTGTISIIADCSSGIEPLFALAFQRQHFLDLKNPLKPYKLMEVNKHFKRAAEEGGFYSDDLVQYLAAGGKLRDRPEVPDWAKRVFVTAHDIAPEWHVRMQAAFQRYVDNAVSKTVNFPREATVEDVERVYLLAYRENCKGITIYREGSREWSVLSHVQAAGTGRSFEEAEAQKLAEELTPPTAPRAPSRTGPGRPLPQRERLPDERQAVTHKFRVGEQEGYLTVGLYEDGRPGEIFITVSKQGSTISGLMGAVAQLTSVALQYGVPLETLVRQMRNTRFEPAGPTGNPNIPFATSIVDYIFRWLGQRFLTEASGKGGTAAKPLPTYAPRAEATGVACPECGSILFYQEGCLICRSCGYTRCS